MHPCLGRFVIFNSHNFEVLEKFPYSGLKFEEALNAQHRMTRANKATLDCVGS